MTSRTPIGFHWDLGVHTDGLKNTSHDSSPLHDVTRGFADFDNLYRWAAGVCFDHPDTPRPGGAGEKIELQERRKIRLS